MRAILDGGNVAAVWGRGEMKAIAELVRFGARSHACRRMRAATPKRLPPSTRVALEALRAKLKAATGRCPSRIASPVVADRHSCSAEVLTQSAERAARRCRRDRLSVVLKIVSADIPTQDRAGGVRLNLSSRARLPRPGARSWRTRSLCASARIDGVSVQEQVVGGLEMIVGCSRDEQFGPSFCSVLAVSSWRS